jgi:hypothetical protein
MTGKPRAIVDDAQAKMDLKIKANVRAELFRCAIEGKFLTYEDFYHRMNNGKKMRNFPYQKHLKKIAEEEKSLGYPDITFVIYGKDSGLPHFIAGRDARNPDVAQLDYLKSGTDDVIKLYCPDGTANPYRS